MTLEIEHAGVAGMKWGQRKQEVAKGRSRKKNGAVKTINKTLKWANKHPYKAGLTIYGAVVATRLIRIFGPTVLKNVLAKPYEAARLRRGAQVAASLLADRRGLPSPLSFAKQGVRGAYKVTTM
jgi:hypothetical protein